MANGHESGSQFVVDLGEIKLPPLVEKQVAAEIEATVLRALADSDFGSAWRDVPADVPRDVPPRPFPFKSKEESPWGFVATDPPDPKPLEVSDHTEIMKAIMDNPLQVLRCLPKKYKDGGGRPSGEEVLEATLRVDQIGDRVKDRIRAALRLAPKIEEVQAALPEPVKQAVDSLRQQLTNKTVQEKLSLLRNAGLRNTHRGLAEGMEIGAKIIQDGQASIYSRDHGLYKLLRGSRAVSRDDEPLAGKVADNDAIAGTFAAVALGPEGGLAVAAIVSAATIVAEVVDYIFGPIELPEP